MSRTRSRMETFGDAHFLSIALDGNRIGRVASTVGERVTIPVKVKSAQLHRMCSWLSPGCRSKIRVLDGLDSVV